MPTVSIFRRSAILAVAVTLGALLPGIADAATESAPCAWQVETLPVPDGTTFSSVSGTDDQGGFSGDISDGKVSRIAEWKHGKVTLYDTPAGYARASAEGQNTRGDIVGVAATEGSADYASFILSGGEYRFLPTLEGHRYPRARAINSRGDAVGVVAHLDPYYEVPVLWPSGGGIVAIDTGSMNISNPSDIDDDGTVLFGDNGGPYTWKDGTVTKYALPDGYDNASTAAIGGGKVIANVSGVGLYGDGFVWDTPTSPRRLESSTGVFAMNSVGMIAGQIDSPQVGPPAVWPGAGPAVRLPLPAGVGGRVSVVGDDGRIGGTVGWSTAVVWKCAG